MRLKEEYRTEITLSKSRFIGCAAPVTDEAAARAYIDRIRHEFPDASHVCTAYVLGPGREIQRSSDNHEPAGTAGVPMLESILHSGLSDVAVCAVRYFGGIKLGAGGLIRAYSGLVTKTLQEAPKLQEVQVSVYEIQYPYELSGILEGWLRRCTESPEFSYGEDVTCRFVSADPDISEQLRDLTHGKAVPELRGTRIQLREL